MRCSTWRGNDLTKLNRQVQLWVWPRFEPPTPHLCMMSYTGREPVFLLSFIPSDSYVSFSFTILSPSPLLGVETPPADPGNLRQIQNILCSYSYRIIPSCKYIHELPRFTTSIFVKKSFYERVNYFFCILVLSQKSFNQFLDPFRW